MTNRYPGTCHRCKARVAVSGGSAAKVAGQWVVSRTESGNESAAAFHLNAWEGTSRHAAGKKIRLTEKETAILKYLYRAGGRVVGRDTLLVEVWGYNAGVTTHTLETHVYRLRQKIEPEPQNARILVTEPGGYKLVP